MITTLLFDLDGVLIDLCDIHKDCFLEALFRAAGLKVENEYHNTNLNGLPTSVKLNKLGIQPTLAINVNRLKQELTLKVLENIKRDDDLFETLNELSIDYNIFCCSNSIKDTVELVLKKLEVRDIFEEVFGNDSVMMSKPSPEMYFKAMCRHGANRNETLAIEDSSIGEETIKNAGVHGLIIKNRSELTLNRIQERIEEIERV